MRLVFIAASVIFFHSSSWAGSAAVCDSKALNSRVTLNVASQNLTTPKTFEVIGCDRGIYTAKEIGSGLLTMKIQPKYSQYAEVKFIKQSSTDEFSPVASGRLYKESDAISFEQEEPVECTETAPQQCSEGCEWYPPHGMCMPIEKGKTNLSFHFNQFLVTSSSTGPRGTNGVSAPNMWMLEVDRQLSPKNVFAVNFMGTSDKWTLSPRGYPLLMQAGESNAEGVPYIDFQHPHSSPVMGLTFSDIISLDAKKKLTFFFAPRGEATAGPQAFMHRASSAINPDAPLAHHLQDVFHITSTVVGVKLDINNTSLEASIFSGVEPSPSEVTLDVHKPDSFAFRANHKLNETVSIGGSIAKMKSTHRGEIEHSDDEIAVAAWVTTSHLIKSGKLSTSTIWGQVANREEGRTLNSFLEEFVYQLGKNNFYGRVEILQRTPEQLNIEVTDGSTGAKWITPLTVGYERNLVSKNSLEVGLGGAVTKNFLPDQFKPTYGGNPYSGKVYLRIGWGKNKSWK